MNEFRLWRVFFPSGGLYGSSRPRVQFELLHIRDPNTGQLSTVAEKLIDDYLIFIELPDFANNRKDLSPFNDKSMASYVFIHLSLLHTVYEDCISFAADLLIFLKYYDSRRSQINFVGHMVIPISESFRHLCPELCKRAQLNPRTELQLYEVDLRLGIFLFVF